MRVSLLLVSAPFWAISLAACGGDSLPPFVEGTAYGVDPTLSGFRTFTGSRLSIYVGIITCTAPIGGEAAWLTMSVPEGPEPNVYTLDPMAPLDPEPGTSTATVTIAELTGTSGDMAISGYVQIDDATTERVQGLADLQFPEGRFGVRFDVAPCIP